MDIRNMRQLGFKGPMGIEAVGAGFRDNLPRATRLVTRNQPGINIANPVPLPQGPPSPEISNPKFCLPPPPKCSSFAKWNGQEYVCYYKCEGSYDPASTLPDALQFIQAGNMPRVGAFYPGVQRTSTNITWNVSTPRFRKPRTMNIFQGVPGDTQSKPEVYRPGADMMIPLKRPPPPARPSRNVFQAAPGDTQQAADYVGGSWPPRAMKLG